MSGQFEDGGDGTEGEAPVVAANWEISYESWRLLALAACIAAMFWTTVTLTVASLGGPELGNIHTGWGLWPAPWFVGLVFGGLIADLRAMYVAAAGVVISTLAVVFYDQRAPGLEDDQYGVQIGEGLANLLVGNVGPWLWIAVSIGAGALLRQQYGKMLGLPEA